MPSALHSGWYGQPTYRCFYCQGTATLYATGNPAQGVAAHYLCDNCQRNINLGKVKLSSYWRAPAAVSPPSQAASLWSQSLSQSNYPSRVQITVSQSANPPSPIVSPNSFLPVIEKTGPVVGYRAWTVKDDRLVGFMAGSQLGAWPAGAVHASCTQGRHREPPPSADCTCGFHAWADPTNVEARAGENGIVVGAVQLWGKLIEHGQPEMKAPDTDPHALAQGRHVFSDEYRVEGWRGEWARPLALLKPGTSKAMAEFYKVAIADTEDGFELLAGELAR